MTKRKQRQLHKKPGPKPIKIDVALVERLAQRMCSIREIAACLGIEDGTLRHRMGQDAKLCAAISRGQENGRATLRVRQWNLAMDGSVPMAIFLGKQYLGQRDQVSTEVTVARDPKNLREMSDEQLQAVEREIEEARAKIIDVGVKHLPAGEAKKAAS